MKSKEHEVNIFFQFFHSIREDYFWECGSADFFFIVYSEKGIQAKQQHIKCSTPHPPIPLNSTYEMEKISRCPES